MPRTLWRHVTKCGFVHNFSGAIGKHMVRSDSEEQEGGATLIRYRKKWWEQPEAKPVWPLKEDCWWTTWVWQISIVQPKRRKKNERQAKKTYLQMIEKKEAQWPIGYGVGLRIKRSSVRIRPWPLRWVLGQGSLLPLSQGEAFTLASISYLAILVKYILAKKKKKKKKKTLPGRADHHFGLTTRLGRRINPLNRYGESYLLQLWYRTRLSH